MNRKSRFVTLALLASGLLPAQIRTYFVDAGLDQLFEVSLRTGARSLIGSTANNGLAAPADLSWRAITEQLWTVDADGGELGTLDRASGVFTPVYTTGISGWTALAWNEIDKRFYLCRDRGDIYTFVPATNALTMLGPTGFGALPAMDTDRFGKLLAVSDAKDVLTIDRETGAAFVNSTTLATASALTMHPHTGELWVYEPSSRLLLETNLGSGAHMSSFFMATGLIDVTGLEIMEPRVDGYYFNGTTLYSFDKRTFSETRIADVSGFPLFSGSGSIPAPIPFNQPNGITFNPLTGKLWATDRVTSDLGTLDPRTGAFTKIGLAGFFIGRDYPVDVAFDPRRQHLVWAAAGGPPPYAFPTNPPPTGGVHSVFGQIGTDSIPNIAGITVDRYGTVYVARNLPGTSESWLYGINPVSESSTLLARYPGEVWRDIEYDAETDDFLVFRSSGDVLRLARGSWATTIVGDLPTSSRGHIALRQLAPAYVIDEATNQLGRIDLATGIVTPVGSMLGGNMQRPTGLAYWRERGELWTVDSDGGEVGPVDPMSGAFRTMCATNLSGFEGIAWHSGTQRFYLSRDGGDIYELDPIGGALRRLGPCGYAKPYSLEVDAEGSLFTVDYDSGTLVKLDLATGAGAPVVPTVPQALGLGFEPGTGGVFTVRDVAHALFRSDIDEPLADLVGGFGAGWTGVRGLQVIDIANATVARTAILGQGCGGMSLTTQVLPRLQSVWWMNAFLPQSQSPLVLAIGYSDPQFSLAPFGAPGCEIRTRAAAVYPIANGSTVGFRIPANQSLLGRSLFVQAAARSPNANQLGAVYSNGLRGIIGW
ncbi:MAG: hypothetical protein NXI31_13390 [bacterium]|nr:hypothetical protein [bacterium]